MRSETCCEQSRGCRPGGAVRGPTQLLYRASGAGQRQRVYPWTGRVLGAVLTRRVTDVFDFRLGAIIRRLGLRHLADDCHGELFRRLVVYGHVGRTDLDCPWELIDQAGDLR